MIELLFAWWSVEDPIVRWIARHPRPISRR